MALSDRRDAPVECPDAERLAQYVDNVLDVRLRAEVEKHLVECRDCREVVYQGTMALRADGVVGIIGAGDARTRVRRRGLVTGSLVGLAAAAAVVLALRVGPWLTDFGGGAVYGEVLRTLGTTRTTTARLAGFSYATRRAPLRSAEGAAPPSFDVQAVLTRARERAAQRPTADSLHAFGVAGLVAGNHDEAIAALERAAADGHVTAPIQNDLAAAYLARAEAQDLRDDYARALAAADRAIRQDARLAPAYFNRALALEGLLLGRAAEAAWKTYLDLDGDGSWAAEARRHLAGIDLSTPVAR